MAVFVNRSLCSIEGIQIETADEPYVLGFQTLTMNISYMGLSDGVAAFLP